MVLGKIFLDTEHIDLISHFFQCKNLGVNFDIYTGKL